MGETGTKRSFEQPQEEIMKPLQLAIPQLRRGKMGSIPLGPDYMKRIASRVVRIKMAIKMAAGENLKNNGDK